MKDASSVIIRQNQKIPCALRRSIWWDFQIELQLFRFITNTQFFKIRMEDLNVPVPTVGILSITMKNMYVYIFFFFFTCESSVGRSSWYATWIWCSSQMGFIHLCIWLLCLLTRLVGACYVSAGVNAKRSEVHMHKQRRSAMVTAPQRGVLLEKQFFSTLRISLFS